MKTISAAIKRANDKYRNKPAIKASLQRYQQSYREKMLEAENAFKRGELDPEANKELFEKIRQYRAKRSAAQKAYMERKVKGLSKQSVIIVDRAAEYAKSRGFKVVD